jgi:PKD repeat protein
MVARGFRGVLAAWLLAGLAACDSVPLTAPTESTIQLFANGTSVPLGGGVDLIATVTEKAGTPVQNGTLVTFATSLGRLEPAEAQTTNGRVTVRLLADGRSGTAKVTALSGGAAKAELEIPIGGAAAETVVVRAEPSSVNTQGGTVAIIATVFDAGGGAVPGVSVTFSTTAGALSASTATTDANGEARTSLTTARQAEVTANAGSKNAKVTVSYIAAPTIAITASPTAPSIGEVVTFQITLTPSEVGNPIESMHIEFGDGSGADLGNATTSVSHVYATPGTYTVRVTVRDVTGQVSEQVTVIGVQGVVGVSLIAEPQDVAVNAQVKFTAAVTGLGAGETAIQFRWDFGDGTVQTTPGNVVFHTYTSATPASKNVTVSVTTTTGKTGFGQVTVSVH